MAAKVAVGNCKPLVEEFEEKPFFKDKPVDTQAVMFPCPFESVDDDRYPLPPFVSR